MRSKGVFWVLQLYRFLPPLGTIIFPELSGSLTLIVGCLHLTLIFYNGIYCCLGRVCLSVIGASLPARNLQSKK